VRPQVAERVGQRTKRSSIQAPRKYPPNENNAFTNGFVGALRSFFTFVWAFTFVTLAFAMIILRLQLSTYSVAYFSTNKNNLLLQTVKIIVAFFAPIVKGMLL
jgi:hypothetical protein